MASNAPVQFHPFQLKVGAETLRGDTCIVRGRIDCLFLHGAGTSSRQTQTALRLHLASRGMGSAAFDFSGHGDSSANHPGSLQKRLNEAEQVMNLIGDHLAADAPRTIVGISMGSEIALRLACDPANQVEHVVTLVGAMYDAAAFELPFGPAFSEVLRRPHSWRDAGLLDQLENFTGDITLLRAQDDAVIPAEVADLIAARAVKARTCRIVELDCDHRASAKLETDAGFRTVVGAAILRSNRPAE